MSPCPSSNTHTPSSKTSWGRKWDTMKLAPELGRASSQSPAADIKLTLDIKKFVAWHILLEKLLLIAGGYINTPYRARGATKPPLYPRQCSSSLPFFPVSFYHFPRLFTTNTRAALPELIMDSQAAIYCQVLPHGLGLAPLSWRPSIQEHGGEGWLCAGAGCDMLGGGDAWCHPVAWRGPIKPWENYVTFCWAGPFRAIEVQWIESCRGVIFPLSCVCVWEKAGAKK